MKSRVKALTKQLLPSPVYRKLKSVVKGPDQHRLEKLRLDHLLIGGESGLTARKYARLTDNLLRPSTLLSDSPHVKLLKLYDAVGEDVFSGDMLSKTEYMANAREVIGLVGNYFGCKNDGDLNQQIRFFIDLYMGIENPVPPFPNGHSGLSSHLKTRPIKNSNGFHEIIDGHHRSALAFCKGEETIEAEVRLPAVHTPLQGLLMDGLWTGDEPILYQPITAPEVQSWPLVRKCTDRASKMDKWLAQHPDTGKGSTYIDLGCNYGWFVNHMSSNGYEAYGVERDICAIETGAACLNVQKERIIVDELTHFLTEPKIKYDIVSCFSVLHHFALGKGIVSAAALIKMLDNLTKTAFFFDTGESGEAWFKESLSDWSPDYIEKWMLDNTSFTNIERLGIDEDRVEPYEDNYGRMLFVCTRK